MKCEPSNCSSVGTLALRGGEDVRSTTGAMSTAMNIRVTYVYPPIPDRRFDWSAVDDATYDGPGCPIGTGATEREAVMDLYEQVYQDADASELQAEFDRLSPKAETGEQHAHLCWLSQRIVALSAACHHESITTADGHGAYCKHCGETTV